MLKIRLQRTGRKHDPTYRVVLTDSKNGPKSGKFIEILGHYDARKNDETVLKGEKIQYWIGQGAKPSDTVHNLLLKSGIIKGETINVLPKKAPIVKEEEGGEEKTEESAPAESEESSEEKSETPSEEVPVEESKEEEKTEEVEEVKKEEEKVEKKTEEAPKEESKED